MKEKSDDSKSGSVLPEIAERCLTPNSPATLPDVPSLIAEAGDSARFAWDEFFSGTLRNAYTRRAYRRAADRFFRWIENAGVALTQITPGHVGRYLDERQASTPTKKLELAALRHLFDRLVQRHAMILNPATAVRAEKHQAVEGKTPEMTIEQARRLLRAIDTATIVGLRDRAILAVLIYTAARVGAVAGLRLSDFATEADQSYLRFHEKNGKLRKIPVRHDLHAILTVYLAAATMGNEPPTLPLFRSVIRRTKTLTTRPLTGTDIARMLKRRLRSAGLPTTLSPHSFRVTTITDLLTQGVPLEDVQNLAGHSDPRTTRLYDRRNRQVTRNVVERISV